MTVMEARVVPAARVVSPGRVDRRTVLWREIYPSKDDYEEGKKHKEG